MPGLRPRVFGLAGPCASFAQASYGRVAAQAEAVRAGEAETSPWGACVCRPCAGLAQAPGARRRGELAGRCWDFALGCLELRLLIKHRADLAPRGDPRISQPPTLILASAWGWMRRHGVCLFCFALLLFAQLFACSSRPPLTPPSLLAVARRRHSGVYAVWMLAA